jgi:phospholipase C
MVFDHTSILKRIEWRFGLAPLTPRDASSDISNLALALNISAPVVSVPTLPKPDVPFFPDPCFQMLFGGIFNAEGAPVQRTQIWNDLGKQATANGFAVKDTNWLPVGRKVANGQV